MSFANGPAAEQITTDLAELTELETKAARLRMRFKVLYDRHEAFGGDRKELKHQYRLHQLTRGEARSAIDRHLYYSRASGLIAWEENGQGVMFSEPPPRPPTAADERLADARAYGDGWNTAKSGHGTENCHYLQGTSASQQWHMGWHDYFEDNPDAKKPEVEVGAATPEDWEIEEVVDAVESAPPESLPKKKRGRPRKDNGKITMDKPGWNGERDFTDETTGTA